MWYFWNLSCSIFATSTIPIGVSLLIKMSVTFLPMVGILNNFHTVFFNKESFGIIITHYWRIAVLCCVIWLYYIIIWKWWNRSHLLEKRKFKRNVKITEKKVVRRVFGWLFSIGYIYSGVDQCYCHVSTVGSRLMFRFVSYRFVQ